MGKMYPSARIKPHNTNETGKPNETDREVHLESRVRKGEGVPKVGRVSRAPAAYLSYIDNRSQIKVQRTGTTP